MQTRTRSKSLIQDPLPLLKKQLKPKKRELPVSTLKSKDKKVTRNKSKSPKQTAITPLQNLSTNKRRKRSKKLDDEVISEEEEEELVLTDETDNDEQEMEEIQDDKQLAAIVDSEFDFDTAENSNPEIVESSDSSPSSPSPTATKAFAEEESEYEKKRRMQIEMNMKFLQELGVAPASVLFPKPTPKLTPKKRKPEDRPVEYVQVRRSPREKSSGVAKYSFEDVEKKLLEADRTLTVAKRGRFNKKTGTTWGGRVYDSVNGTTCHQCRQKTTDEKGNCCRADQPPLSRHKFCRTCLKNRYHEELEDVLKNPNWLCPPCRGVCNCSHCRRK